MRLKITVVYILVIFYMSFSSLFAADVFSTSSINEGTTEDITKEASDMYNLDEFIGTINSSVNEYLDEDIDFKNIADQLINKNNIDYTRLLTKLIGIFAKEISSVIKGAITILIILVIMAVISNLELEKNGDISKIAHLSCYIIIATITVANFLEIVKMLKSVVNVMTTLMQVISPFLMSILIATGAISTTGLVQPLLLFLASSVGFIVSYFVIPLICISVAFNVICSISENIKLEKLGKLFSNVSIWTIGVVLTVFLGVLSLETTLSSSVDSLGVKTTQAAMSNFVPVVGKFFSDSFEVVVGATKIIGKTGGVIGIIGIIAVAFIPILKVTSVMFVYMLLASLAEPLLVDDLVIKYISSFADMYKTMLGILIGVTILFVISTGIIINLVNSVIV